METVHHGECFYNVDTGRIRITELYTPSERHQNVNDFMEKIFRTTSFSE